MVNDKIRTNVHSTTYLGTLLSADNNFADTVQFRFEKGLTARVSLVRVWKNGQLPICLKRTIVRQTVIPISLYGCEAWSMNNAKMQSLLNNFSNRITRSIANDFAYDEQIPRSADDINLWRLVAKKKPQYSIRREKIQFRGKR